VAQLAPISVHGIVYRYNRFAESLLLFEVSPCAAQSYMSWVAAVRPVR